MRVYELVLILRSSLTEEKRKKILETIKGWLKEAKVNKEDNWGQKTLAYAIKREKTGFYHFLSFESENLVSDFEKKLLGQEDVMRHLLLRRK